MADLLNDRNMLRRVVNALENRGPSNRNALAGATKATQSPDDEKRFQAWFQALPWHQQFQQQFGEAPDANSPDYNYRAAYRNGVTPTLYEYDKQGGQPTYHWPSVAPNGVPLKAINHPTAWMEDYMRLTGRDPHEGAALNPAQAQQLGKALQMRYSQPNPTTDAGALERQMLINSLLGKP